MTDLGELSLWVALLMAVWGAALSFAGGALAREDLALSGARGLVASSGFVALAAAGLWWAFLTDDFAVRLVATFSSEAQRAPFKLSAAWAGRAGVVLMFAFACAGCSVVALRVHRAENRPLMPWLAGTCALVLAVVLVASAAVWNPYVRLGVLPEDGRGLDPRLQDLAAAVRTPSLCLGYGAAAVALAVALSGAVRSRCDAACRRMLGTWTLVAWCFLSTSVLLTLRIAYTGADFSGSWIWKPAGAASLSSGFETGVAAAAGLAALLSGATLNGGWKRVRTVARYTLVAGGALFACGLAATTLQTRQVVELTDGGTIHLKDPFRREWSFTSQGASRMERPDHFATSVALRAARGDERPQFIATEFREYFGRDDRERFAPQTTTGIHGSLLEDVGVTLVSVGDGRASVRIAFVPFVTWVWIGGVAVVIGGALMVWPTASKVEGIA
jgi:cytochrome c biogenesis factor